MADVLATSMSILRNLVKELKSQSAMVRYMEQPFLISYSGDHGKSKGEGLTQGKPTTCLKEPGTSFNTLLSKK